MACLTLSVYSLNVHILLSPSPGSVLYPPVAVCRHHGGLECGSTLFVCGALKTSLLVIVPSHEGCDQRSDFKF